jgi:hypothetical protein
MVQSTAGFDILGGNQLFTFRGHEMNGPAQLVILCVIGAITAAIAASKQRNPFGWFFIGFFFPCIGLIIVIVISDLGAENRKWLRADREKRQLQEQLRQERLMRESHNRGVDKRLDAHDVAIGVDTRGLGATEAQSQLIGEDDGKLVCPMCGAKNRPTPFTSKCWSCGEEIDAEDDAPRSVFDSSNEPIIPQPAAFYDWEWLVDFGSHRSGAMNFDELCGHYHSRAVDENTQVWTSGMAEWKPIRDIDDLWKALTMSNPEG